MNPKAETVYVVEAVGEVVAVYDEPGLHAWLKSIKLEELRGLSITPMAINHYYAEFETDHLADAVDLWRRVNGNAGT